MNTGMITMNTGISLVLLTYQKSCDTMHPMEGAPEVNDDICTLSVSEFSLIIERRQLTSQGREYIKLINEESK
jgi:hypothetical protein